MAKMTALTERLQIAQPVVAGVVIEMRRRQHDPHFLERRILTVVGPGDRLASIIPPKLILWVKPAAITEMMEV